MVLKIQYANTTNIVDTSLLCIIDKKKSQVFFKDSVLMSNFRINNMNHDFHV